MSIDCVIQINNIDYEVPSKYSKRKIKIRYSPDNQNFYVVNPDGTLEKIKLLDKIANSKCARKKPVFNIEEDE